MATAQARISVDQIPEPDMRALCGAFTQAVEAFYADPNNMERFKKWQEQRKAVKHKGGKQK